MNLGIGIGLTTRQQRPYIDPIFDGDHTMGRKILVIGDSIAGNHAVSLSPSAITVSGTTATVTCASHGLTTGATVYGFRSSNEALNGRFTVTRVDNDTFTVSVPSGNEGDATARTSFNAYCCDLLYDRGFVNWLSALNGGCFDVVGVHAESGSLSTYLPTLMSKSGGVQYSWVAIIAGVNDFAADATVSSVASTIIGVANGIVGGGRQVIIKAIGPWDSNNASYSAARNQKAMQCNALLKAWCSRTRGAFFVDSVAAGTTATSTTGAVTAGVLADGLHPTANGAYLDAKRFVADYPNVLSSPLLYLPTSAMQDAAVSATSRQLWPNPLLAGTGGLKQGDTTPPTGNVGDSQVVYNAGTATSVASLVAATFGQSQRVVLTASANNDGFSLYTSTNPIGLAAGESLRAACRSIIGTGSSKLKSSQLTISCNFGFGARTLAAQLYTSGTTFPQIATETLTLLTPSRLVSSITGLTSLRPVLSVTASAADTITVDSSRLAAWGE